ncbi:primase-like DNA-binding domain-containing protein [Chloroflexota bacterium]
MGEPEAVRQAVIEYRDQEDILHDFLDERCLIRKIESIDQSELYKAYKVWCEDNDTYIISKPNFNNRIREKGIISGRRKGNKATWIGIRVLLDDEGVNQVNAVNDFPESFLHEASTGKTLVKTVNLVNPINPDTPKQTCFQCGTDTLVKEKGTGSLKCSKCGRYYTQGKGGK